MNSIGIVPAANVALSDVLFSSPAEKTKADTFVQPTESTASEWKLTLKDGCDMAARKSAVFFNDQCNNKRQHCNGAALC